MFQSILYILIENNKIMIGKAKIKQNDDDFKIEKEYGFKLIKGCKFIPWER